MPIVRFQLRNEYGLGKPELHGEASQEDPKAVLDGVAVAGLVGILRQLGDLAEFAAEVFHGLQEQVMMTASRSQNLMGRVQGMEAALSSLEKRVLAQTSHIHFAYAAGSDWHARIRNEQHHFIDNDLPRFIMDSYEGCRDPPRLHLLDKFDTGGPGSCLRRYSDPTFFRRVSGRIDELNPMKIRRHRKSHKIKKKRSFAKNSEFSRGTSTSNRSSRLQFSSPVPNRRVSPTPSINDLTFDSGVGECLNSFDSRSGSGYIEHVFSQSDSMHLDERGSNRSSSSRLMQHENSVDSVSHYEESFSASSITRKNGCKTSSAQLMQREDSVGSVSLEEESSRILSSMGKKGSKTSLMQPEDSVAQLMQPEDSVGSVSCEKENASISGSLGKKGSKTSSVQPMQHGDSVGSLSHEEESASVSSRMRKKGLKASSAQQMQHEDSACSVSREEESASISCTLRNEGSKASSTQLKQREDSVGSDFLEEERTAISLSSHSPPRIASDLSSISWEEKTEIMDLSEPNTCGNQSPELVLPLFQVGEQEEAVIATNVDDRDIQYSHPNILKSTSNDIDSEVDHYLDALNTIESESETDRDYEMKQMVEQVLSSDENTEIRVAVEELTSYSVDHQPSNAGSDAASGVLSDEKMPQELPETSSPELSAEQLAPQVAGIPADFDCLQGISVSQTYPAAHDPSSPGSFPTQDEIKSSSSAKDQESPKKHAGVDVWTNGGLLGLQPAKPPVLVPSDDASLDTYPSVPTFLQKGDDGGDKLHVCKNKEPSLSTKQTALVSLPSDLGAQIDMSHHSNRSNLVGHSNGHDLSAITLVAPASAVPVAPTAKIAAAETTKESEESSAGVFGLGHRLFMNSFRKKLSLVYDEKPDLPTSDISSHQKAAERSCMDQFVTASPVNSFPPSPPLEHMKISFHPVNDFETSKLGLKFSDESNSREKVRDMFASFQLVSQSAVQLHGAGSYSDVDDCDDTFCRSSPCISDGYLSNLSESNSEQWESDSHGASGRPSMDTASAPNSYGNCVKEAEGLEPDNEAGPLHLFPDCVDGPGLNLPSFDSIKSLPKQEKYGNPEPENNDLLLQSTCQSAPLPLLPPPRPSPGLGVAKPHDDVAEDEQEASEASAVYPNQLASHVHQPKLTPVRPQNITEKIVKVAMETKDQQKSNAIKETFLQGGNERAVDDKEDFLQQIRTKPFNLRRTVTAKPTTPTQPGAANVKVTAILKKSNAIRQAVGTNDGEDDSWSDA